MARFKVYLGAGRMARWATDRCLVPTSLLDLQPAMVASLDNRRTSQMDAETAARQKRENSGHKQDAPRSVPRGKKARAGTMISSFTISLGHRHGDLQLPMCQRMNSRGAPPWQRTIRHCTSQLSGIFGNRHRLDEDYRARVQPGKAFDQSWPSAGETPNSRLHSCQNCGEDATKRKS